MQSKVYPVTVFCLGIPEMQVSHMCTQRAENRILLYSLGWCEAYIFF